MEHTVYARELLAIDEDILYRVKMMSEGREWSLSIAQENMLVPQERNIGDN